MFSIASVSASTKRFVLFLSIALFIAICWSGVLDKLSTDYLEESFLSTAGTYGVVRAINAAVSILQSAEIEASIVVANGSINPLEILDPINDLAERFSGLLAYAIGSIVTQKVILILVTSNLFNSFLSLVAFLLVLSIYTAEHPFIKPLSRLFIFSAFLRLSFVLMVLLNSMVDTYYLNDEIAKQKKQVTELRNNLSSLQEGVEMPDKLKQEQEITKLMQERKAVLENLQKHQAEYQELIERLSKQNEEIETEEDKHGLFGFMKDSDELRGMREKQDELEEMVKGKLKLIETVESEIEDIDYKIENPNGSGVLKNIMSNIFTVFDISRISDYVKGKIEAFLNLMIFVTIKTLIFPLLFMYMILKAFQNIWKIPLDVFLREQLKTLDITSNKNTTPNAPEGKGRG